MDIILQADVIPYPDFIIDHTASPWIIYSISKRLMKNENIILFYSVSVCGTRTSGNRFRTLFSFLFLNPLTLQKRKCWGSWLCTQVSLIIFIWISFIRRKNIFECRVMLGKGVINNTQDHALIWVSCFPDPVTMFSAFNHIGRTDEGTAWAILNK